MPAIKRWHGVVVAVAVLAIGAYLAMIVGPRFAFGHAHHPVPEKTTLRTGSTASTRFGEERREGARFGNAVDATILGYEPK